VTQSTAEKRRIRRGPSVEEVAVVAGVGTATVDRVLNSRGNVSDATRTRVLDALDALRKADATKRTRIAFICEAGDSFNRSLTDAVKAVAWRRQELELTVFAASSFDVEIVPFAQQIEREAESADGVVIVAREHPAILRAARAVMRRGKPVICLATDLPRSCRNGFVGSNEHAAGAAAAGLMGDLIRSRNGRILFIACGEYHAAKDRERGFRTVLNSEFRHLNIEHRLDVKNDPELTYQVVKRFMTESGIPHGIYSVAGGNSAVGKVLQELGAQQHVVFIGHELNPNSRSLLTSGIMNYLITRDQEQEVMLSLTMIEAALNGRPYHDQDESQVRIVCRHTCS